LLQTIHVLKGNMMLEKEISLLHRFAKKGDAEAFSEIVRRHAGLVYGASLRVLEDKTRAADVVQETFFQLYKDAGRITGSLPIWLHRVATRKAIDVVRKDSRRKRREAKYAADKHREAQTWEDVSGYIDEGLDELDHETREILMRHFFEGRSMADIADQMSVSQPTVSRRVESGVSKLRETLRKRGVIVATGALVSLLAENAVEAAPALVMKELGKIALLGTTAASSGSSTAATGAVIGIKAKIVAVTAAATIGTVGVVAYKDITQPSKEPTAPIVREAEEPETKRAPETSEGSRGPEVVRIDREPPKLTVAAGPAEDGEDITRPGGAKAVGDDDAPAGSGTVRKGGGYGSGQVGGMYFRAGRPREKENPDTEDSNSSDDSNSPPPPPPRRRGAFGGGG
jgi:RNA polymerase sigma factor (sigma-70 family)